jgi:hypothetical protein
MRGCLKIAGFMVAVVLTLVPGAHAQGCVLCYTSLAGMGSGAMKAFELAMFALLIPALTLFAGVFLFIYLRARTTSSIPVESPAPETAPRPKFSPGIAATVDGRI